jgi:hypothetical protein
MNKRIPKKRGERGMAKEIIIEFEKGGQFVAELFEKEAPRNTKTLWEALPLQGEAIHGAVTGQSVWIVTKDYIKFEDVHEENQLVMGNTPGTVALESYGPETNLNRSEITIVYGPRFYPRNPFRGEVPMNRVGLIKDNLEKLIQIGMNIREYGKQKVTIRKKE